jgi:hypothetical protein
MRDAREEYWMLRERHADKPLGKKQAVRALVESILSSRHGRGLHRLRGIELGCGQGCLLQGIVSALAERTENLDLWGLDRDRLALEIASRDIPCASFVVGDLRGNWQGGIGGFDFILIANVLHEVVSESMLENCGQEAGWARSRAMSEISGIVGKCRRLLGRDGILAVFDGVDCHPDSPLTFRFGTCQGIELLQRFSEEYSFVHGKCFETDGCGNVRMGRRNLLRFLTKIPSLTDGTWEIERKEVYPAFFPEEIKHMLLASGFSLLHRSLSISDIEVWRSHILPSAPDFEFPFQHCLFVGRRND